jgi:hypothetical protein
LREWWWRRKEEQRDGAVGYEMWMYVCVCSVGLLCQGRWFSFDLVESSSYVGLWKSTGKNKETSYFCMKKVFLWDHFGNRLPIATLF